WLLPGPGPFGPCRAGEETQEGQARRTSSARQSAPGGREPPLSLHGFATPPAATRFDRHGVEPAGRVPLGRVERRARLPGHWGRGLSADSRRARDVGPVGRATRLGAARLSSYPHPREQSAGG